MNTTQTTKRTPVNHLPLTDIYIMVGFSGILVPFILAGNLLVIVSYKINVLLQTRTYTFLVSLAISDFLVGGVNLPMWISCMIDYTKCHSQMFTFFDLFGAFASILHLTAISIERYIAIAMPYLHRRLSIYFHRGTLAFIWTFSAFMASLSWYNPSTKYRQIYNCAVFVAGFVLPATVIVSMYLGIFRTAQSLRKRTPSLSSTNINAAESSRKGLREDHKVAMTVAFISGLFIIAWLPFFVVSIIATFCRPCLPSNMADLLRMVASVKWLHYSNSVTNPIVYAFRDREIRKTFLKLLRCRNISLRKHLILRRKSQRVPSSIPTDTIDLELISTAPDAVLEADCFI